MTEALAGDLRSLVIGQDPAVEAVVETWQTQHCGLQAPGKPLCTMLFLGPTGVGKTHLVEALGRVLYGTTKSVLRVDCAEFQYGHEIAKLIGSPPGYLGHRETNPMLSQRRLQAHWTDKLQISLLLFDEIEKASDALWNLLLGILDKASLTLGDNSSVDFSRAMIFLTSNLGSREIEQASSGRGFGFSQISEGSIGEKGVAAARKRFTPEFMNRLDRVVAFRPLTEGDLESILHLELDRVQERILESPVPAFVLKVTKAAESKLISEGYDRRYGARHLKRSIEKQIVRPLTNLILSRQIGVGETVEVSVEGESGPLVWSAHA